MTPRDDRSAVLVENWRWDDAVDAADDEAERAETAQRAAAHVKTVDSGQRAPIQPRAPSIQGAPLRKRRKVKARRSWILARKRKGMARLRKMQRLKATSGGSPTQEPSPWINR